MLRIYSKTLHNNFVLQQKILAFNFCSDSNKNGSNKKNQSLDNLETLFKDNIATGDDKNNGRIHKNIKHTMTVFNKKKRIPYEKKMYSEILAQPKENTKTSLKEILDSNTVITKPKKNKNKIETNREMKQSQSPELLNIMKNNLNIKKFEKSEIGETDILKPNDGGMSDEILEILDANYSIQKQPVEQTGRDQSSSSCSVPDDILQILDENSSIRQNNLDNKESCSVPDDILQILDENSSIRQNNLDNKEPPFDRRQNQFRHRPDSMLPSGPRRSNLKNLSPVDMETDLADEKPPSRTTAQDGDDLMQLLNKIDFHQVSRVFPVDMPDTDYESFIDKVSLKRLNIFEKDQLKGKSDPEEHCLNFLDVVESCEFRQLNMQVPPTQFHEWIQWTQDKKLWRFPIDNEQDSEELSIKFHEHVFPQQYLTGRLPKTGPIGQFMNYVCVGLSQSPHLTVQQKRAHISWYEDYLSSKIDECNIAVEKSKTN